MLSPLLTQPAPLLFFSGLVALWALPSTLPQTEGTFWTALGFSAALGLSVSFDSASAEASGAGQSVEAGPFAAALGDGPGLVAKEGKLFSSRLGGACKRWHAVIIVINMNNNLNINMSNSNNDNNAFQLMMS